jgi:hypothetical protein
MKEEQKEQLRQKWKSWLDEIGNELGWLLVGRDIYYRFKDIVLSNTKIQSPFILHKWIIDNYVAKVTTSIIRLTDKHPGTISLYWLIKGIEKNPDVITRDYFISQWSDKPTREIGTASKTFDMFAKVGEQCVDPEKLNSDIQKLKEETGIIKTFRDKWIAHLDEKQKNERIPSFGNIDKALDIIDEIWRDYNLLLTCSYVPRTRKPGIGDWEAPLRHPWIEGPEQEENEG